MGDAAGYVTNVTTGSAPRRGWLAIVGAIVAVYAGVSYLAPLAPARVDMYVIRPMLWLLLGLLALRLAWHDPRASLRASGFLLPALAIGAIQVGISAIAAFLLGWGRSPYGHAPLAIILNLWYAGALLVGRELARWYLVSAMKQRSEALAVAATTVLLWLVTLSPHAVTQLTDPDRAFDYLGRFALPAMAASLLATYLALLGGPLASIGYLGVLTAFEWLSPLLPDLPWPVAAMIGVMVPLLGLLLIQPEEAAEAEEGGISLHWMVAAVLLVVIVWFNTGVFGVRPVLVQGISMEPGFHTGDVVIVRPVDPEDLKVGDIIQFRDGNHDVLHRIIEIRQEEGGLVFITQGDNNDAPDPPVPAENVRGRLALHIPKAGLPGIYFKRLVTAVVR